MNYKQTTQTPNSLFDIHLRALSESQLKVLLIIIRRTLGYMSKKYTGRRVEKAWITQRLFTMLTGLSARAVSEAIEELSKKRIIQVYNESGREVFTSKERQLSAKLYFSSKSLLDD